MESAISSTFIWRRVHSLMGFWLVMYLILHLLTNSQAALWIGDDGHGFVRMVNALESLPYLHAIELIFIGIPLAIHLVWGVHRALTAKPNSGTLKYSRNRAYTWQRISSWILLFGIVGHVAQMRFVDFPKQVGNDHMVKIAFDEGLYTLAPRLGVRLYNCEQIQALELQASFDPQRAALIDAQERAEEQKQWVQTIRSYSLQPDEVVVVGDSPGKVMLLMIRDTFKSPWMIGLYTVFVLAAAFHAFNGFWTFLIAWGMILSYRSQKLMVPVCMICALVLACLGLAAIWGSHWS